jgi:hypothetical protein
MHIIMLLVMAMDKKIEINHTDQWCEPLNEGSKSN